MIRLMLICLFFLVTSVTTAGQANPAGNAEAAEETAWVMPRTEYGVPDFQGTWFFGSRTPLQRPRNLGTQTTYSEQEIREQELQMRLRLEDQAVPLNPGAVPLKPARRFDKKPMMPFWGTTSNRS